jgi:hypothetical protein
MLRVVIGWALAGVWGIGLGIAALAGWRGGSIVLGSLLLAGGAGCWWLAARGARMRRNIRHERAARVKEDPAAGS